MWVESSPFFWKAWGVACQASEAAEQDSPAHLHFPGVEAQRTVQSSLLVPSLSP